MSGFIHPPIYLTPPRASTQAPVYLNPQYYPSTTYVAVTPAYPAYTVAYLPTCAYPVPTQTPTIAYPVVPGFYFPYAAGIQQAAAAPSAPEKMSSPSSPSKATAGEEQEHKYESFPDPVISTDNGDKTQGASGDHVMSGARDGGGNAGASSSDSAGKGAEKKAGGK